MDEEMSLKLEFTGKNWFFKIFPDCYNQIP